MQKILEIRQGEKFELHIRSTFQTKLIYQTVIRKSSRELLSKHQTNYLDWGVFYVDMVLEQIRKIDLYKASGFEGLNSRILKHVLMTIPTDFTRLLKLCRETSTFPEAWKIA